MTRPLFMALAALVLVACERTSPASSEIAVAYDRDARTGLCFAKTASTTHSGYQVVGIASVPCSPEVLRLAGESR